MTNIELAESYKNKKVYPSFLQSHKVGIQTLQCLTLMKFDEPEEVILKIEQSLKEIYSEIEHCKKGKDLTFGAAGYLYALLLLEKNLLATYKEA
jgi:hypothetical protein